MKELLNQTTLIKKLKEKMTTESVDTVRYSFCFGELKAKFKSIIKNEN